MLLSEIEPVRNVLTVSSHVCHGYVGNDALQFPLNLRNWNVDCIHTTDFSTHPGHGMGAFAGQKTDSKIILDLYNGLKMHDLQYDAMIIGYIATRDNLNVVFKDILSATNNNSIERPFIVLDPVMGDNGKYYVTPEIVEGYKTFLENDEISIDLLTPNQFEFEILTDLKIDSWDSLKRGLDKFCSIYTKIKNLVITSVQLGDGNMYCVGNSNGKIFYYKVEEVDAVFSGSGDLFLGLLMDELFKNSNNLQYSLGKTIKTIESVLQLTHKLAKNEEDIPKQKIGDKIYIPDLKLVESKSLLLDNSSESIPVLHSIN